MMIHPSCATWVLPAERAPLEVGRRCNLRALAARPGRFEHHLMVVGRAGDAQLELATASEPLYFAHQNISDEYALAIPTGDPLIDGFPVLTFLSTPETHADVGRIRHRAGQLVLHPHGWLHWSGRLRPPFVMPPFPGPPRAGVSLVMCASAPREPAEVRPLGVSEGLAAEVKAYGEHALPFMLADLLKDGPKLVAALGDARAELLVSPREIGGAHGGYLLVLEPTPAGDWCVGDFIQLRPGERLDGAPLVRGLWIHAGVDAAPPPPSWDEVPAGPWPCFEDGERAPLPLHLGDIQVEARGDLNVSIAIDGAFAEIPRHWLARMLFRLGLHEFRLGYVETYGGFFYDDRDGFRLGLRGGGEVRFDDRDNIARAAEALYRAVAPDGYREQLG